jgi:hypothetical protein
MTAFCSDAVAAAPRRHPGAWSYSREASNLVVAMTKLVPVWAARCRSVASCSLVAVRVTIGSGAGLGSLACSRRTATGSR